MIKNNFFIPENIFLLFIINKSTIKTFKKTVYLSELNHIKRFNDT